MTRTAFKRTGELRNERVGIRQQRLEYKFGAGTIRTQSGRMSVERKKKENPDELAGKL